MALSKILGKLGFTEDDFEGEGIREYRSNLGTINFVVLECAAEEIDTNFYDSHREIWNENISKVFVAIINDEEVLICDSKTVPNKFKSEDIKTAKIDSFKYGKNSEKEEYYLELLKKESIDRGYFWEEFHKSLKKKIKKGKHKPIDVDLLDNLKKKKSKIKDYLKDFPKSDELAQKLIDRCLFIRFLEDRIERNKLKNLLEDRDVKGLLDLFTDYNRCLNGDLFEEGDISSNINKQILGELNEIFGKHYKYKDNQLALVPYQFDKIPILLISHIYEKLLDTKERNGEGIVFTPENVADYTIEKVFESELIKNKIENDNIRVLDPSCGSGIFLVKFFKRLIKERRKISGQQLTIQEKHRLLKKSVYGIDINSNALRIAAFSLYLEIFENISPDIINKEVFEKYENGENHFMLPELKDHNLICGNSLFNDNIFKDEKFDLILGNPPWSYKKFSDNEKRKIEEKWPDVSYYESSQCFLFKIYDWMDEDSFVGMVVNLSNFTNEKAAKFRKGLLKKYSLNLFFNLVNIKEITFGSNSENACVLTFNKKNNEENEIEFIIPDMMKFSKITRDIVIKKDDIAKIQQSRLSEETWHISILGLNKYLKLIEKIESDVYLFSLEPEYKQYLQSSDIDEKLKNEFEESKCFLSGEAKLFRIDEKNWNIMDFNGMYKIKDMGVQLNIYEKRIPLEQYSETFEQGATFYSMEKHGYLFCWGDIPEDNGDILKFLKNNMLVDWIKNPEIKKSNDENTVTITELENSITLNRNLSKKEVIIIYNREINKFILKEIKGKFNVYTPDYKNIAKKKYESIRKEGDDYLPKIQSIAGLKRYVCPQPEGYIKYGSHLERARDFNVFRNNKLVINRGWPIKSFIYSSQTKNSIQITYTYLKRF